MNDRIRADDGPGGAASLCGVIGYPASASLSPAMHGAGYAAAGIAGRFVYCAFDVPPDRLGDAVRGARALGIRGLSVTMPHKVSVVPLVDVVDPVALAVGAVNTVVNRGGVLYGYNTDHLGVAGAVEERRPLAGARALVVGSGGAARAALYAVTSRGAVAVVAARNAPEGAKLAGSFGAHFAALEGDAPVPASVTDGCDVIVNATPVGTGSDESPLARDAIRPGTVVLDTVYTPRETRLLRDTAAAGGVPIGGLRMLLHQGAAQFILFTGVPAPLAAMDAALSAVPAAAPDPATSATS